MIQKKPVSKNLRWWKERGLSRLIFLKQRWQGADRCCVTCPGNNDGLGAQVQARLSGMLYAHCQGMTYVHTPLTSLDFTPDNASDWPAKWERFLGLGTGSPSAQEVAGQLGDPRRVSNPTQIQKINNSFWSLPNCHAYADLYPDHYERLTAQFAARYHAAPKAGCVSHYTPGVVNVAVHLRRGKDLGHKLFLLSHEEYSAALTRTLRDAVHAMGARCVIRVFSDGDEAELGALQQLGVEFHMNEDLFSTFHSLVNADVLVMAKSALSYAAALLSCGLVIYEPMHHPPLPKWVTAKADGSLDRNRLAMRLRMSGPGAVAGKLE
jgi:hypothetical protein